MATRTADLLLRYVVELVDRGTKPLLAHDREVRRSLEQTDRAMTDQARTARSAASDVLAANRRVVTGQRQVATGTRTVDRAMRESQGAYARATSQALRFAAAEDRAAAATTRAARAQSVANRATLAGARAMTSAAGVASSTASRARAIAAPAAAVAGVGGAAGVVAFAGFEQQMDRVQAVAGATGKQIAAMNAQAKKLGAETAFSAREAADGMYQLSTSGFKANQVMKILPGTLALASASGTDLASAAALQGASLRGFGLGASEATRAADVLAKTVSVSALEMSDLGTLLPYVAANAKQTGTAFEEVAATAAILSNAGVKAETIGTSLRTTMLALTNPSQRASDALHSIGISADDLAGKPISKTIGEIATGLKGLPKGEKLGIVATVFGREAASGVLGLLDKGKDNIDKLTASIRDSQGESKRMAKVMRDNVAGAWDEFTGSIETASIALVERFGPALKNALKGAAGDINKASTAAGDFVTGFAKGRATPDRTIQRGPGGRVEGVKVTAASGAETTGAKARKVAGDILGAIKTAAGGVASVVSQVLDALKPAMPFLQNVLLPLLEGVAKGVLGGIVAAFKIAVPVLRIFATALGALGNFLAPLKPVIEGIGTVLGFVFGPAILGKVAKIAIDVGNAIGGKLGGALKLVGQVAKVATEPLKLIGGAISKALGFIGKIAPKIGAVLLKIPGIVARAGVSIARKFASVAVNAVSAFTGAAGKLPGKVFNLAKDLIPRFASGIAGLPGRFVALFGDVVSAIPGILANIAGDVFEIGKSIVTFIVNGIASAPGAIADAIKDLIPNPVRDVGGGILDFARGRSGGQLSTRGFQRFQGGGSVMAAVSSGEMVEYGGQAWMVPGARVAADNILTSLPVGARVFTGHGQQLLASGMHPDDVLRAQMPHFGDGGRVLNRNLNKVFPAHSLAASSGKPQLTSRQVINLATTAGWGRNASHADEVSHGESDRHPGVVASDKGIGLMQVTPWAAFPNHDHPLYKLFQRLGGDTGMRNPLRNLRMGKAMFDEAGGWSPWHGTRYLTSGPGEVGNRLQLGGRRRTRPAKLPGMDGLGGAFGAGFESGLSGARRISRDFVSSALAAVRIPEPHRIRSQALSAGTGGPSGDAPAEVGAMLTRARSIANRNPAYQMGGGHGPFSTSLSAYDCSGYVSNILGPRVLPNPMAVVSPMNSALRGGEGRWVTVGMRGTSGDQAHTAIRINGAGGKPHYFESGGGHGPARVGGWPGSFNMYHPKGFRGGGQAGPRRTVNQLLKVPGTHKASGDATALVGRLAESLSNTERVGYARLSTLTTVFEHAMAVLHAGKPGRAQEIGLRRLMVALRLTEAEMGRRTGVLVRGVQQQQAQMERSTAALSRRMRRSAIDEGSTIGLGMLIGAGRRDVRRYGGEERDLLKARRQARKAGAGGVVSQITEQLRGVRDSRAEAETTLVERRRARRTGKAQARVDRAQTGIDLVNTNLAFLDASQRVAGRQDTASGMRERADLTLQALVPALTAQRDSLYKQADTLRKAGDQAGATQAFLAAGQAANDLANAFADAQDLTRQAAMKTAENAVDAAASGSTMSNLGLSRLELEQKIAGTYETGGQQRADYIRSTVMPAIEAEIKALQAQQAEALRQGDESLARQIGEQVAGKQNDKLQSIVDATEQTATNTDKLKEFGGSLAFEQGGQLFTDDYLSIGTGG